VVIGVEVSEHLAVDGYWSMVETRHHLVFVQNSWFRGCVLGRNEPFTGLALPVHRTRPDTRSENAKVPVTQRDTGLV